MSLKDAIVTKLVGEVVSKAEHIKSVKQAALAGFVVGATTITAYTVVKKAFNNSDLKDKVKNMADNIETKFETINKNINNIVDEDSEVEEDDTIIIDVETESDSDGALNTDIE